VLVFLSIISQKQFLKWKEEKMKRVGLIIGLVFIGMATTLFHTNESIPSITVLSTSISEKEEVSSNSTPYPANPIFILPTWVIPTPTIVIPYFTKEDFENGDMYLKIPEIEIDSKLGMACGSNESDYDFSKLDELPLWICPNDGPYLSLLGLPGASAILGHRQWGPTPKIFAKLDKIEKGDNIIVSSGSIVLTYKAQETIELKPESLWQKISEINNQGKENNQSYLVLITCTPYGTDWRRLLVIATLEKGE